MREGHPMRCRASYAISPWLSAPRLASIVHTHPILSSLFSPQSVGALPAPQLAAVPKVPQTQQTVSVEASRDRSDFLRPRREVCVREAEGAARDGGQAIHFPTRVPGAGAADHL